MIRSLHSAESGLMAAQNHLEVVSHNVANANTAGFKKSRAEFADLIYQNLREPKDFGGQLSTSPTGVQVGHGARVTSVAKQWDSGPSIVTRNPLDMEIEGEGFFHLITPEGESVFTRDGQFKRDAEGRIVDKNGYRLEPEITIPAQAVNIQITPQGLVRILRAGSSQWETLGQIELVTFINPQGLRALGRNVFAATPESGFPQRVQPGQDGAGFIAQGQYEGSNVNLAEEMVELIKAQRYFEINSKAVQASDRLLEVINSMRSP